MEHGRDLYPAGVRLCLLGGDHHRLVQPALRLHGKPEIFNSDQGAQFTSHAFTGVLKGERIAISMDGRWTTSSWNGCGAASSMKTCA